MRVSYHPDFPKDIKGFEAQYRQVSTRLALRFCADVDAAIEARNLFGWHFNALSFGGTRRAPFALFAPSPGNPVVNPGHLP